MGFWNDGIRSPSPSRDRSRTRSHTGPSKYNERTSSRSETSRHYASQPSFSRSASSFLSNMTGSGQSRSRGFGSRARPRDGFIARIRKFLRDLYGYMRRHPVKVFFLVIMPLITGGALTKILATVGVRLPSGLQRMVGSQMGRTVTQTQTRTFARGGARDFAGGSALPGMGPGGIGGSGIGVGETIQSALGIAKMFM